MKKGEVALAVRDHKLKGKDSDNIKRIFYSMPASIMKKVFLISVFWLQRERNFFLFWWIPTEAKD